MSSQEVGARHQSLAGAGERGDARTSVHGDARKLVSQALAVASAVKAENHSRFIVQNVGAVTLKAPYRGGFHGPEEESHHQDRA